MTVQPLSSARDLDAPDSAALPALALPQGGAAAFSFAVTDAFGAASSVLGRADAAEKAFAAGRGGMQEMVLERAQADIALSIASAAASRAAQSLSTILGMQI